MFVYKNNFKEIEESIKSFWKEIAIYSTRIDKDEKPFFCLTMFPYPSAAGLHIGHPFGYIANDIVYRFTRMNGYNVLCPFGYDAFGLPAEQFAIQTGQHPSITTRNNIDNMRKQIDVISLCFDQEREIDTSDPEYYKWTQWIFLKMYNSFFDETESYKSRFGIIKGRAKDVSVLKEYLKQGAWSIDPNGYPKPNKNQVENKYSEEEIRKAIDKSRIAYTDYQSVNWCSKLGTVLSNEEITKDGKSERGNYPVEKKMMKQWMLRITKYADRLLSFDGLDWPEETVKMQQNWIGRSIGMNITFKTEDNTSIEVFTTRPDTLIGATFIAISQDHPIYGQKLPDSEEKIGIFTGKYAYHVFCNTKFDLELPFVRKIPIWVANYVLNDYGSGAVMGVPAHDERDFEFAKKYRIEIKPALIPSKDWINNNLPEKTDSEVAELCWYLKMPFCEKGEMLFANKLEIDKNASIEELVEYYEKHGIGERKISYRLRDWVFSRQRYWGEPFPIVYSADGIAYPVDESELPVRLPEQIDFAPNTNLEEPSTPLERSKEWISIRGLIVNGKFITDNASEQVFKREANTMPNWAGSSWYYLRYLDPKNTKQIFSETAKEYWCDGKLATVDCYIGGSEHAVLHYLYSRFWHMVLFDLEIVSNPEPYQKVVHQGLITADAYMDQNGNYVDVKEVEFRKTNGSDVAFNKSTDEVLSTEKGKMGKRYKNGIDPVQIVENHGCDVFRLHMMYMAPLSYSHPWNSNMIGMERFCQNVSSMIETSITQDKQQSNEVKILLHKTIKNVTENYNCMHYNKCIALLIEFYNSSKNNCSITDCIEFLKLLHPLAPHISEYWYQKIQTLKPAETKKSILLEPWPTWDSQIITSDIIKVTITLNGKLKKILEVNKDISDEKLKEEVRSILNINKEKIILIRLESKIIANVVT